MRAACLTSLLAPRRTTRRQAKGITGILNGVEDIVKPDNDELGLEVLFNATSLEKKAEVKAALQKAQGFAVDAAVPLFVFMGRLDAQKGVDVLFQAVEAVLEEGLAVQFVFMGSGIEELEEVASDLEARFPKAFKAVLSFKGQEKYKTYAASDFALMPSRYEPCGLVQMEGMRFGVLPIVAPTGGLADTVQDLKASVAPVPPLPGPSPLPTVPHSQLPPASRARSIGLRALHRPARISDSDPGSALPFRPRLSLCRAEPLAGRARGGARRLSDPVARTRPQTGFVLEKELDMDDILPEDVQMIAKAIKRAAALYSDTATIRTLQVAAMKAAKDFSWVKATKQYVEHFLVSAPLRAPAHPIAAAAAAARAEPCCSCRCPRRRPPTQCASSAGSVAQCSASAAAATLTSHAPLPPAAAEPGRRAAVGGPLRRCFDVDAPRRPPRTGPAAAAPSGSRIPGPCAETAPPSHAPSPPMAGTEKSVPELGRAGPGRLAGATSLREGQPRLGGAAPRAARPLMSYIPAGPGRRRRRRMAGRCGRAPPRLFIILQAFPLFPQLLLSSDGRGRLNLWSSNVSAETAAAARRV